MFDILPLIIILLSLGAIIVIVARKFSVLANLNVESIQEVREAKMKERIIGSRIKRVFFKQYHRLSRLAAPAGNWLADAVRRLYSRLNEIRREDEAEKDRAGGEDVAKRLLAEADDRFKSGDLAQAEGKYIETIGLDPKNVRAFRQLARLYYERKDYNESRETYRHAIKLADKDPDRARSLADGEDLEGPGQAAGAGQALQAAMLRYELALAEKAMDEPAAAQASIEQALELEPMNPRYLDTKLEISIINKDKIKALEAYDKLKAANPDNQKLASFKEEIDKL